MFNLATEYIFCLDENVDKSQELFLLLLFLEEYVNGASIQIERIEKTKEDINKKISALRNTHPKDFKKDFYLNYLYCDTHFFFISIDKCFKFIRQLSIELKDNDIKDLETRLDNLFDIKTVRNHLEHIEQRCLGYKDMKDEKNKIKTPISDFGNFTKDGFSFNEKIFPSNIKSLEELQNIYNELIKIIHDKYAMKSHRFLQKMEREERLRLTKESLR